MRLLNFMLHLLLVTLLAVSGIGAANAKVASGPQHLGQGSQPVESALNLLWHQEKTGISYDAAPGSSVVAKGGVINPADVRFSQSSIKGTFSNGGSIDDLAAGLKNGTVKADQIPAIRLVEKDGQLFSLDNRRLEAFKRAGENVPYRMATPEEVASEAWKFTTKNGGTSIRIRGE